MAQIMIHGKHWGRAVNEHYFTKIVKESDCASKSKFMSLKRSAKPLSPEKNKMIVLSKSFTD